MATKKINGQEVEVIPQEEALFRAEQASIRARNQTKRAARQDEESSALSALEAATGLSRDRLKLAISALDTFDTNGVNIKYR